MTRLKVEIRPLRSGDESQVFFLGEETLKPLATAAGHPERFDERQLLAVLAEADVFVAEAGGELAGFVAIEREPQVLSVRCVCVSPAHEHEAVAHQLVEWVEGLAFSERVSRLRAVVPAADQRSRHLYETHEFIAAAVSDQPETIVLEKRLPEV